MEADALITARHQAIEGILDERQRRLHAAVEAKVLGHGDVKRVSEARGDLRTYRDRCHMVAVLEPVMPKDERALPPLV